MKRKLKPWVKKLVGWPTKSCAEVHQGVLEPISVMWFLACSISCSPYGISAPFMAIFAFSSLEQTSKSYFYTPKIISLKYLFRYIAIPPRTCALNAPLILLFLSYQIISSLLRFICRFIHIQPVLSNFHCLGELVPLRVIKTSFEAKQADTFPLPVYFLLLIFFSKLFILLAHSQPDFLFTCNLQVNWEWN